MSSSSINRHVVRYFALSLARTTMPGSLSRERRNDGRSRASACFRDRRKTEILILREFLDEFFVRFFSIKFILPPVQKCRHLFKVERGTYFMLVINNPTRVSHRDGHWDFI